MAVLVVTYNNEHDVPILIESLRQETRDQTIKVIVADNSPTRSTLLALAPCDDILVFRTGGNLGYAGGINAATRRAGAADAFLVLNPDMRLQPGAVRAMREKMAASGAGAVVPLLVDDDGSIYPSLRREPSITRAFGDALLGSKLPGRPGWLSEMDYDADSYRQSHTVDWATGAALLIRADIVGLVGEWDERYFLYSEETDYLRRIRAAGATVWFEPRARMRHSRGGSGTSPMLDALMAVNKIRYVRKFNSSHYAAAFHSAVLLSAFLRSPLPGRSQVFLSVLRRKGWDRLPRMQRTVELEIKAESIPPGAVIIPAHNEAAVIRRTLAALAGPIASGAVEVVVACNCCTDATADVARSFPGVRVVELPQASKTGALNAGDREATRWPRLYLDADIVLPLGALCATLASLSDSNGVLCARPSFRYDTHGASWPVRAYYRARNRLPQASESMWGAGVYGLNLKGHERLAEFPDVTSDDCYIDRLYGPAEKVVIRCEPVEVRTPRSTGALLATLRRVYRGNSELHGPAGSHTAVTLRELAKSVRGPASAVDASCYVVFALAGRIPFRRGRRRWERDETSRR
ncbi:glycosyltransferase [Pseudarthrobacter sulfonivorans]|uniref:glycosyltransferase n=1 Tax=Pseudarthrobacter sulfonivorans TaxID=121292 RepID=UPI002106D5BF|nr:glycosyltransferase family 2 protein [Pseudarthrobacter sulfonivorans]